MLLLLLCGLVTSGTANSGAQQLLRGETLDVELLRGPFNQGEPTATVAITPAAPLPAVSLEAFVATNFTRDLGGPASSERLLPFLRGPCLRFRFRADHAGLHSWAASVTLANGSITRREGRFEVSEGWAPGARGFAEIAPNGRYFMRDGKPLFLIGGNTECWSCVIGTGGLEAPRGGDPPLPVRPPANGTFEFDRWFGRLAAAGGNFARFWLNVPQGVWTELAPGITFNRGGDPESPVSVGAGIGKYDQASMWRADYVLALAERLGISVLVSIEMARTEDEKREWEDWSAYHKRNGGMCENATDFWTNEAAMVAFERRLRYIVARFAHVR